MDGSSFTTGAGADPGPRGRNSVCYLMKNGRLYDGNALDEVWPRARPLSPQWWWKEDPPARR